MGAQASRTVEGKISDPNFVDNTDKELGDLDLFEEIPFNVVDSSSTLQSLYSNSIQLGELFEKAYNKSMNNFNRHVKLNNLQFNYREKNKVIIQDLKNKLRLQEEELKEKSEENYKTIRQTKDIINKTRDEENSKKYFIILLVIIILINLGLLGLFTKRKIDTGNFTLTQDF